jgi:hypothetical protein
MTETGRRPPRQGTGWWVLALPLAVLLLHAFLYGSWIVDDAGISFVYARNLAAGNGLVSQPGLPPVEGFSNFLWVLALAPAFLVRLFDPVLTPKILALSLVAGAFVFLRGALDAVTGGARAAAFTALLLLALNTSFVAWAVSGLENPLYAFLLSLLLWLCLRERRHGPESPGKRLPFAAGAVAAAVAMTRPEGILFAALYPVLTPFAARADSGRARTNTDEHGPETFAAPAAGWRGPATRVLRYAAALGLVLGGFLLFRVLYFGDLLPNTYYAKGGPSPGRVLALVTLQPEIVGAGLGLVRAVAGHANSLLVVAALAGTGFLAGRRRLSRGHAALAAFMLCGVAAYLLLPPDWMTEYRFGTPFLLFSYTYAAALAAALGTELVPAPRRPLLATVAVLLAVGGSLLIFLPRSLLFAAQPTVPFSEVRHDFGERFNRFADLLGVRQGSILLPDVGGTLWSSRLRVYDLGGLTDHTIALTRDRDHQAFYDYVFEQAKPTFIHTHQYWTMVSGLELDPRMERDYIPLYRILEPWVLQATEGQPLYSGDYVRREVAEGKDAAIAAIRRELAESGLRRKGPAGPALPPRHAQAPGAAEAP